MKDFLKKNILKIIFIFLVFQPIIDCLTSISLNVFHLEITFGIIVRLGFLLFLIGYNQFIEESSKKSKWYLFAIALFTLLYIGNVILTKDTSCLFYELKNLFRYLYFPLLLINLWEIKKHHSETIPQKTIVKIYLTYILLILIPMLTHTDFVGYFEGKVGTIGWFNSTNEISAILSGLLPIVFICSNRKIINLLFFIGTSIVLFSLGSKITIVSLGITILFYLIKYFLKSNQKKKIVVTLIPICIVLVTAGILLIPKTSFYKNIQIHLDFLGVEHITDVLQDEKLFDHFIFSSRLTFLKNTRQAYQNSNFSSKLLGIGFIENYGTDEVNLKTIEMDIFDIFYRIGIVGSILYILPVIWVSTSENKKKNDINQKVSIGIFLFIGLVAGHVLTSPAVSIYLAILMLEFIQGGEPCKQQL